MGALGNIWQRIGTKLYLALGFAVFLTLVSSAVGVYYFERSGDLNYQVRSESVPALESSWAAAREAERLRSIALGLLAEPGIEGDAHEVNSARNLWSDWKMRWPQPAASRNWLLPHRQFRMRRTD